MQAGIVLAAGKIISNFLNEIKIDANKTRFMRKFIPRVVNAIVLYRNNVVNENDCGNRNSI